ncbi:aminotransferase class IV [Lutibacter flavus]|uniref:branched-chain-amino-acid transaminase n=1 Tax=Lutibacter flavus TaxID=691689 RepID=A0A238VGB4_9FLAO|nr:aminotransferase class IV [Lutibacter flavus]SNR33107.1 branched-chain amino acid aminotransferase [Lutibacter flavus]
MINFNGYFIEDSKELFNANNRAFKYGDALFETIKVKKSKVLFLEDHYFRLMASMRMLRMEIPMSLTLEFFENEILKTVEENKLENARIRFSVFRKDGGLYTPLTNEISYLIEASKLNIAIKEIYTLDIYKDYYIYSGLLSTLKTTNKITNVLASIYAKENNLDNCVLLNEKKNVVEAINGNIFVIFKNKIKTPALTEGCVKGIMRKKIIELISENNEYSLEETSISPFELQKADEVFITNAIIGIQPVTNYKKSSFNTKITEELAIRLDNLV